MIDDGNGRAEGDAKNCAADIRGASHAPENDLISQRPSLTGDVTGLKMLII